MGRPRKRQKTDSDPPAATKQATSPPRPIQPAPEPIREQPISPDIIDPSLSMLTNERTQFENICNGPMAQTIRNNRQLSFQDGQMPALHSGNSDSSHSQNEVPTPDSFDPFSTSYPTDVANWPDFSTLDMLPLPVEDKYGAVETGSTTQADPDVNPEALSNLPPVPACPCLPNLYLTLSTLSTLSSFPFNQQTISTIEAGYRTAKGVIYCPVCPRKFDTGSSNLMLSCTLITVLADQWNRFRKLNVEDLRKAFSSPDQQKSFVTAKEGLEWRTFAHRMLRAYVFGDHTIPPPPGSDTSSSPIPMAMADTDEAANTKIPSLTLIGLVDALTRRQKQWHRLEEVTDEFPDRVTPDLQQGHMVGHSHDNPGKHLCLEIVNHARCIIDHLDGPQLH